MSLFHRNLIKSAFIGCLFASSMALACCSWLWSTSGPIKQSTRTFKERITNTPLESNIIVENWNKTFVKSNDEYGTGVWGYGTSIYTCGFTNSFGAGSNDFLLVKWDDSGNQEWNKTWGGSNSDICAGVWANDTSIYTVGTTGSYGAGGNDIALVKWTTSGVVSWYRTWGGSGNDQGADVWCDGKDVYVAGLTNGVGAGDFDIVIVKWDSAGNQLWNRTWGGASYDGASAIRGNATAVYLAGYTSSFGQGNSDAVLVKWDAAGNQVWNRTWGGVSSDNAGAISISGNSLYLIGTTSSYGIGNADFFVVQWDASGNQAWNRTWGISGSSCFAQAAWSTPYSVLLLGYDGMNGVRMVKWNVMGDLISNSTWGQPIDNLSEVWAQNENIYLCGIRNNNPVSGVDFLLVKFDASKPLVSSPPDKYCLFNTTGNNITWRVYDDSVGTATYTIMINQTLNSTGPWINGASVMVTHNDLAVGMYNFTLIASDGLGNTEQDTVWVMVLINSAPLVVPSPAEVNYTAGMLGNVITWTITDSNVWSPVYELWYDGGLEDSGSWSNGSTIQLNVDYLSVGSYNMSLIVEDGIGSRVLCTVWVNVIANVVPSIMPSPADFTFDAGTTNHVIVWNATDSAIGTATYIIKVNNTQSQVGTWTSGSGVSFVLDGLGSGSYNVTIIFNDGLGGVVQDTVIVTVVAVPQDLGGLIAAIVIPAVIGGGLLLLLVLHKKRIINVKTIFKKAPRD